MGLTIGDPNTAIVTARRTAGNGGRQVSESESNRQAELDELLRAARAQAGVAELVEVYAKVSKSATYVMAPVPPVTSFATGGNA